MSGSSPRSTHSTEAKNDLRSIAIYVRLSLLNVLLALLLMSSGANIGIFGELGSGTIRTTCIGLWMSVWFNVLLTV